MSLPHLARALSRAPRPSLSAMRTLSARLVPPATLLGVDFGQRYLGLALSDGSNLVARPLTVYDESTVSRVFGFGEDSLGALITRHRVQALIVGLPFTSGMMREYAYFFLY
jgi:hypothetical protein